MQRFFRILIILSLLGPPLCYRNLGAGQPAQGQEKAGYIKELKEFNSDVAQALNAEKKEFEAKAQLSAAKEEKLKIQQMEQALKVQKERIRQLGKSKTKTQKEFKDKERQLNRERQKRLKERAQLLRIQQEQQQANFKAKQKESAAVKQRPSSSGLIRQQELRVRQEQLAKDRQEYLKQLSLLRQKRQQELKTLQEQLVQEEEAYQRQLAVVRVKGYRDFKTQEEELSQQQKEQLRRFAVINAKKYRQLSAQEEGLAQQAEKPTQEQQKVIQQVKLSKAISNKQAEDAAKIKKIEELWGRARKLYNQGMYEEAITDFEKIIEMEGNPRIKYTPKAKDYIQKAKEKLMQEKKEDYQKDLENKEQEMIQEVLKRQVVPYVEPPSRLEEGESKYLIEPPPIRKKIKETKITMDFDKVGLKSVILFLSQESGVNFVVSQKVLELEPAVSVRFKEVSLDDVIKYITKSLGLIYRIDKEVVWIAHPEEIASEPMETRVYQLSKGGGLFTEFSPISSGTTETGLGGSSAQINKIFTIEDTLKEVVPWPADAKLTYDKRLNVLIVRNTPQNLQMLEDILYGLDIEPCQVLIEARFIEVDITDVSELGLEWKFTGTEGLPTSREKTTGSVKTGLAKDSGVDFTAFSRVAEGLNFTYQGVLTYPQFQTVLHALQETKKLKTLSAPRITTLNNQLASIKVVDEWIYPTRYEYEVVQADLNADGDFSEAGETTYKNVPKDFMRRDVGILLKVIPAVGADRKTINLSLIPEVSEATADAFSYTGGVTLPKFTSRNLSTTIVVNSGDTVVLGGMIKESRTKTVTKVPFLGDIPLLGAFFKKEADSIQRKNLLIFVTAKVLSPSGEEIVVSK